MAKFNRWLMKNLSFIFLSIFCWSLPFAWLFAIPKNFALFGGKEISEQRMQLLDQNIELFKREFKRLPGDLNELRIFSKSKQRIFHAYDGYGQLIDYQLLDADNYVLRSFGIDGIQTRIQGPADILLLSFKRAMGKARAPVFKANISLFNPMKLLGAWSPSTTMNAALFVNPVNSNRKLVVRSPSDAKFIMIAQHDRIEEFMWLPEGDRLIFTASGSAIYKDGLYLWDLKDGSAVNLLEGHFARFDMHGLESSKTFLLALGGYDPENQLIHAFAALDTGNDLDPDLFFAAAGHIVIKLPASKNEDAIVQSGQMTEVQSKDILKSSYRLWSRDRSVSVNEAGHKEFYRLPTNGDIGLILERWTQFTANQSARHEIFPYLNLHLCLWYSYASTSLPADQIKEREVIRSYGAELSRALATSDKSPRYISALAANLNRRLMQGHKSPLLLEGLN